MITLLNDKVVQCELRQAWQDSVTPTGMVEQGGFILINPTGSLSVERWPHGMQDEIEVPTHAGGKRGQQTIVATFHTHPNPPPDYQQEPSLTDIRAVRFDPDLMHLEYQGEFVISRELIYRILPDGTVEEAGDTKDLLGLS